MSRVDQVNGLLRYELANLISREVATPDFLITVIYVDCAPNLESAKIGISVLPEKFTGTALEKLRKHSMQFSNILNKKLKLRKIPKFNWIIDTTEKEASELEKILGKIKRGEV